MGKTISNKDAIRIMELARSGWSIKTIALKLGLHQSTVLKYRTALNEKNEINRQKRRHERNKQEKEMARKNKLAELIRAEWTAKLDKTLKERFGVEFETRQLDGSYETMRVDREPLTAEQYSFIHGYMMALNHVYIWNGRV